MSVGKSQKKLSLIERVENRRSNFLCNLRGPNNNHHQSGSCFDDIKNWIDNK